MSIRDLTILGCSSQQPTRLRNHGAYLLRWNQEGLLFDPGEGTQRQFIFADIAPPTVTRIFVSHFHGDHCLGLGSMLMRLNLDRIDHPVHCYYPASGKVYFDRLRYGTIYHDHIQVIEHPVSEEGIVQQDETFTIEAKFLDHGVDNLGWRIKEADTVKFDKEKLKRVGLRGVQVRELEEKGSLTIDGKTIALEDVSYIRKGDVFTSVIDTKYCQNAIDLAQGAKLFLCESTYLEEHKDLAISHDHMTAKQAAQIAKNAGVQKLILTHFSARYRHLDRFAEEARQIFPNLEVADDCKRFAFPVGDYS
ncbi:MAG: ribonuclease Z [Candidatus Neptunochlamydia sp.]|nr:ribonuclease Z [Candidatus Neptunochlamydia sp.]